MRISDWSSDVCSSDLVDAEELRDGRQEDRVEAQQQRVDESAHHGPEGEVDAEASEGAENPRAAGGGERDGREADASLPRLLHGLAEDVIRDVELDEAVHVLLVGAAGEHELAQERTQAAAQEAAVAELHRHRQVRSEEHTSELQS